MSAQHRLDLTVDDSVEAEARVAAAEDDAASRRFPPPDRIGEASWTWSKLGDL